MLRIGFLVFSVSLGIIISAAVAIHRYMSLPPGYGEDMALVGLPYLCVVYGVLPGLVIGELAVWRVARLRPRVSGAAKKRMVYGGLGAGTGLILLLFYGSVNVRKLAVTVVPVIKTAQKQGSQAVWSRMQLDLLVVNLAPHGHARIDCPDAGTYYYLAFCRARIRAGYPLFQAVRCKAEIRLQGQVMY